MADSVGGIYVRFVIGRGVDSPNIEAPQEVQAIKGDEHWYNTEFHLAKLFDALGKETDFGYDAHHHLNQITDPAGRVTNFVYSNGLLQSMTAPGGDSTLFEYDGNGYPNKITRADGSIVTPTYNARGDLAHTKTETPGDPNLHEQSFSYDKCKFQSVWPSVSLHSEKMTGSGI